MNPIDKMTEMVISRWGNKTLETFRREALSEHNGTAYETIRVDGGPRLLIVLCATNRIEIDKIERVFELTDAGISENWTTFTLAKMVLQTGFGTGLSYQDLRESDGTRTAIILCAAQSETVQLLEKAFALSNDGTQTTAPQIDDKPKLTIGEMFHTHQYNGEYGFSAGDWYAVGCGFMPPLQHNGRAIKCARNLLCSDVASSFAIGFEILPKSPAPLTSDDLITFLKKMFRKHGKPRLGVIISHSVWVSSAELETDEDMNDRGILLAAQGITFPEMSVVDKFRLTQWLIKGKLICEFDGNKVF